MGLWSSIKNKVKKAFKAVWRFVKAAVRLVVRIVITVFTAILPNVYDLLFGFFAWPPKKLRLHIIILSNQAGPVIKAADLPLLTAAVDYARQTLKDRFNVKVLPYADNMIEIIKKPAPSDALTVGCDGGLWKDEFIDETGEFFAKHLAGWNAVPVSLTFPITVFVVQEVVGKDGCSFGPLTDYVTLDVYGVQEESTLAHEIGHACNLFHSFWGLFGQENLMWGGTPRGNKVKWFQKNLFRNSRHVQYW